MKPKAWEIHLFALFNKWFLSGSEYMFEQQKRKEGGEEERKEGKKEYYPLLFS